MPPRPPQVPTCLTLVPLPDESLIGYVFRLAHYRRLPTAYMLAKDCGLADLTNQPNAEQLAALAASASMDPTLLQAISYGPPDRRSAIFMGQRVSQSVLERRGHADRRLCPRCLAESPHHRAIWDLRYVAVCPVHRCLLVDECPECGRPMSWRGGDFTRCRCARRIDFRSIGAPSVADEDIAPTAAVYGLLGDDRFRNEADQVRSMRPFVDLDGADIAEFLFRLGLERMGRKRKVFSSEDPGELAWEAHVVLRRGLEVLDPWPDAFHEAIDAMRRRWGPGEGRSLRMCAGAVERWLSGLPEGRGMEIRLAVEAYRALDAERKNGPPSRSGPPSPRRTRRQVAEAG